MPTKPDSDPDFESLGDDLLRGARDIAGFLFNNRDDKHQKRVFYLISRKRLPVFNLAGGGLWARRSTLRAFIASQEDKSAR